MKRFFSGRVRVVLIAAVLLAVGIVATSVADFKSFVPITVYPCSASKAAVRELSTPPLMATATIFLSKIATPLNTYNYTMFIFYYHNIFVASAQHFSTNANQVKLEPILLNMSMRKQY